MTLPAAFSLTCRGRPGHGGPVQARLLPRTQRQRPENQASPGLKRVAGGGDFARHLRCFDRTPGDVPQRRTPESHDDITQPHSDLDGEYLRDTVCTPGAIDLALTQGNIDATICKSGYTARIRPPPSDTEESNATSVRTCGEAAGPTIELDHLISIGVGGTNSLVLQPVAGPNSSAATGSTNRTDAVENNSPFRHQERIVTGSFGGSYSPGSIVRSVMWAVAACSRIAMIPAAAAVLSGYVPETAKTVPRPVTSKIRTAPCSVVTRLNVPAMLSIPVHRPRRLCYRGSAETALRPETASFSIEQCNRTADWRRSAGGIPQPILCDKFCQSYLQIFPAQR